MLKTNSFLQGMKEPVSYMTGRVKKFKGHMATISYMMATVLFLISPNYLMDGKFSFVEYVKAETAPAIRDVEEETANEAIVLTNHFAISKMVNQVTPLGNNDSVILINGGMDGSTTANTENKTEDMKANSISGADAKEQVDSSSTAEQIQKPEEQETTKKETAQAAQKDTDKRVIDLSKNEIEILQRIVEAEATGENVKGKMLVANVILNRVKDESFPDTVEGVVFQKDGSTYQFSPIKDGRYWSVNISQDTITAIERVMQGEDDSQGALYFSARDKANKSSMSWFDRNLDFLFEYGGHEFFR